jgi:hypothetical protein
MTTLQTLYQQKDAKFTEICVLYASDVGHGEFSALSNDDRARIREDVEELIVDVYEEAEHDGLHVESPKTPLQRLLREHHDICEQILDKQDEGMEKDAEPE